jgi:hypothetical protein
MWDVSADGKRFVVIKEQATAATAANAAPPRPTLVVVSNWFEEVKARMPGRQ